MTKYAVLCGCAPEGQIQKKVEEMHDFLASAAGGALPEKNITVFPNGVFDETAEDDESEILLYFCTMTEADLHAELSGSCVEGVEVVRLGSDEIRKEVISYYEGFAQQLELHFRVEYAIDVEFVHGEALGYERVY